jgi:hypothetical protein
MRHILLLILICKALTLPAQIVNIDRLSRDTTPPKPWNVQVSMQIDMDEQKNNIFDEDGSFEIAHQLKRNTAILAGISELVTGGPQNNVLNYGSLQFRDRILPAHKLHPEFFAQYQFDEVKGLRHRALVGLNARYVVKDEGTFRLFAATGLMYEYEDWDYKGVLLISEIPSGAPDVIKRLVKSTSYARVSKSISDKVDMSLVVFYQARPEYFFKQHRIAEYCQFNFAISSYFSLTLEFDSIYDTDPVVPIKKFYFSFNQGLTFRI